MLYARRIVDGDIRGIGVPAPLHPQSPHNNFPKNKRPEFFSIHTGKRRRNVPGHLIKLRHDLGLWSRSRNHMSWAGYFCRPLERGGVAEVYLQNPRSSEYNPELKLPNNRLSRGTLTHSLTYSHIIRWIDDYMSINLQANDFGLQSLKTLIPTPGSSTSVLVIEATELQSNHDGSGGSELPPPAFSTQWVAT